MTELDGAIRSTLDEFVEAWDAHEPARMALCWAESGNAIDPWGRYAHGRAAVEELLAGEHRAAMWDSTYRFLQVVVRELGDDTALAECEAVIEGAHAPNGRSYTLPHEVSAVLRYDGGVWRFLSLHPSFRA